MKSVVSIVTIMTASLLLWACGNNPQKQDISEVPIKTEVLGLKLCEKSSENAIKKAIGKTTDAYILTQRQKIGTALAIRAVPVTMDISYGGLSWNYVDVGLNQDNEIALVSLMASYESIDRAKEQFDAACQVFTQKYGEGNVYKEEKRVFWTDNINGIEISYEESSTVSGEDRCFCTLRYLNKELYEAISESNVPDV